VPFTRSLKLGLLITAIALLAAGMPATPLAPAAAAAPIDPAVLAEMQAAPDGRATFFLWLDGQPDLTPAAAIPDWQEKGRWVFDTLRRAAQRSQPALEKALKSDSLTGHVAQWQAYWVVNAIAVHGDEVAAKALARQPGVLQVLPAVKLEPPKVDVSAAPAGTEPSAVEWNVRQINADDVWALGITGQGIVLANVDTGVDYTHPALVSQYRGNQGTGSGGPFSHDYHWFDPTWGSQVPAALPSRATGGSADGHGTHVMGTQVGSDGASNQIGVAPGARWIAAYGCCASNQSLLAALQWMLAPTRRDGTDPNPSLRPHAVQNSWGGPGGSLIFAQAMANLKAAGVFVSASAGNYGPLCGSLSSPGDNLAVFDVGASTGSDTVSSLSSRGPNPLTGRAGPDLVAPGDRVRSAMPGGSYAYLSGTSMAGPHVAGAVALLWQANPGLAGRVDYTAELLRKTSTPIYVPGESCGGVDSGATVPNNSAGWGRLDVLRAVQVAGNGSSRLAVLVTDPSGTPLPGARAMLHTTAAGGFPVALEGTADQQGRFEFLVAPGTATVSAAAFGYALRQPATVNVAGASAVTLVLEPLPTVTLRGRVVEPSLRQVFLPAVQRNGTASSTAATPLTTSGLLQMAAPSGTKALAARVSVPGAPVAAVSTDCTGAFTLALPAGTHTLLIEATGYEPQRVSVDLAADLTQTFALTPAWDYAVSTAAFQWIDATQGTRHQLGDDSSRRIDLPASQPFTYYGASQAALNINSNGFLSFGTPYSRFQGVIPFEGLPNNAIYGYTDDLNPDAGVLHNTGYDNGIYTLVQGNQLIVQYNQVEHWPYGSPETFQVILDLASGAITMQYQQVSWPDFTTVGLEDSAGRRGISYSYANSANLRPGLAVRFTPVFGQPGQTCGS
jgi:subtilisin family serine protease